MTLADYFSQSRLKSQCLQLEPKVYVMRQTLPEHTLKDTLDLDASLLLWDEQRTPCSIEMQANTHELCAMRTAMRGVMPGPITLCRVLLTFMLFITC